MAFSPQKVNEFIHAKFVMISGSEDKQCSADVSNVGTFNLPDPAGKAGGACTSTLLKVLNENPGQLSWIDMLHKMRDVLKQKGFDQVPQLSSSRLLDVSDPFEIVPPGSSAKRALLIGINYEGQQGQLSGCHNDVHNIKRYLINHQGFQERDMLVLMDDGQCHQPTKKNIEDGFQRMVQYSNAGDVVFIHYSGHGGHVKDTSGDEDDGFDETLIPLDFKSAGQIVDDDIYKMFVLPMKAGVNVTVLMDSCHSGTAMDLPYSINATESKMHTNDKFNMSSLMQPEALMCCACIACLFADDIMGALGGIFDGLGGMFEGLGD